jgi:hypothetical protein
MRKYPPFFEGTGYARYIPPEIRKKRADENTNSQAYPRISSGIPHAYHWVLRADCDGLRNIRLDRQIEVNKATGVRQLQQMR